MPKPWPSPQTRGFAGGGGGKKYRLEKPDRILVRLKAEHSRFGNLKNQRFGFQFVKEVANQSDSELRSLTKSCIFYISGK